MIEPGRDAASTMEVGAVGGDLPLWRARQAVRHGELRLGVQAQLAQALEGRATSLLGWSVTGGLALGAAFVHGLHPVAAFVAAACLVAASCLCVWALVTREWNAVAGYAPSELLSDGSSSEYEATVALAKGYERGVQTNQTAFHRFDWLLRAAICLMLAATPAGLAALAIEPGRTAVSRPPAIAIRAASACPEYRSAPDLSARAPCQSPEIPR